jgi:hypothetical protein
LLGGARSDQLLDSEFKRFELLERDWFHRTRVCEDRTFMRRGWVR